MEQERDTKYTTGSNIVCYAIGSYHSNAWKSDNPNSGVYETDVAKTLDALNCGYPGCNQGGWQSLRYMMTAIGIDLYNQCTTGTVSKTLNSIATDADHVPCVVIIEDEDIDREKVF